MRWPWTTPPPAKPLGFPSPRPAVPRPGAPTELEGTLEGIIFHNAATGYTVAALQTDTYQTATIVGTLVGVQPGERLRVTGQWATHPQYGAQFQIATYQAVRPVTAQGIETYLGSGLIKGIGPGTAHDIVQRFGERTLTILDESPDLLLTVPGVGPQRLAQIKAAWAAQRHIQEIMLFLQSHGVSPVLAAKIYRRYGDDAMRLVRADPYRLARDIRGVGFPTADDIAQQLGLARDDPRRLAAGLLHVLSQRTDSGHIYTPQPELLPAAAELLQADVRLVEPALADLAARGAVQLEDTAVYLRALYHGEVELAARLRGLLAARPSRLAALADRDWDRALRRHGRALSAEQQAAVRLVLTHPVAVLTGGPGTGKTTSLRALLDLVTAQRQIQVLLAAPTGRAAKRLSETTGRPAQTLHRLLEYHPEEGEFGRNEACPLDADLVVVDESSMLDQWLAQRLLRAIPPGCHLLLVGDVDQLPSVGAGNVLGDLIASGQIPTARLTTIHRQDPRSLIVTNAHQINQGVRPTFRPDAEDFFLFPVEHPAALAVRVVDVVCNRIPRRFGLDPVDDVQVLAPMYRGAAGVHRLNILLQEALNPPAPQSGSSRKAEWRTGGRTFRVGDKVMQIRNDYDRDVFNGDRGRVLALDAEDQVLVVDIDGRPVEYDLLDLDHLVHAYACTIHKFQGSECPAVVVPMTTDHHVMLARNLFYTAVTRAKRLVVLVGTQQAIAQAVRNNRAGQRHTRLADRLAAGADR